MGNQNIAIRYEQALAPKQYVTHVINQVLPQSQLANGKNISKQKYTESRPADIDSHWGPADLSIEQKYKVTAPEISIENIKDESVPLEPEPSPTNLTDIDGDALNIDSDEKEAEERYIDDEELDEEEIKLTEDAIAWDWYKCLPDEKENYEDDDQELSTETSISQKKRNHQHAYKLAFEYGSTDQEAVNALIEILEPSGQAAHTVRKLRELMDNGATAEELLLAFHIREQWKESHEFSKHYFAPWEQYRTFIITWNDAFKLVRLYDGTPDIEEIFFFLDKLLERWSINAHSNNGQSFQQYLSEILGSEMLIDCPGLLLDIFEYAFDDRQDDRQLYELYVKRSINHE